MYLFCFGTRPEIIKQFPVMNEFKKRGLKFKTLFSGQHEDLIKDFIDLVGSPTYSITDVIEHGQTLNKLFSKILLKTSEILEEDKNFKVIVQGDTSTAFATSLASFHNQNKLIHIEAGLRTNNLHSPFPEEGNRTLISHLSDIHFCPTARSVENLKNEGIEKNIFLVGNTVVDSFDYISNNTIVSKNIENLVSENEKYILCTLHRRENRKYINELWDELNILSERRKIIYVKHPSIEISNKSLSEYISTIDPVNYMDMVHLIKNSSGVISDSGGIQEEVICANKKILICRNTTERPETVESGYGKLVGRDINNNINFLDIENSDVENPYGDNVSKKIVDTLQDLFI